MDWLRDFVTKRDIEQRNAEERGKLYAKQLHDELSKVTPMVHRLLYDLGRAYFGTDWLSPLREKFQIVKDDYYHTWRLQRPYLSGYFEVSLKMEMGTPPCFKVVSGAGDIFTKDTSEAELKRVLHIAAEQGTYSDPR